MQAPPMLPWPRRVAARVLAGARGVSLWQRSVIREARRVGRVLRFAAWRHDLTWPPPTLLEDEPLGTLAVALDRPARSEERTGRRAARSPNRSGASTARSKRSRDHGRGGERRRMPSLLVPGPATSTAAAEAAQPRLARIRRPPPPPGTPTPASPFAGAARTPAADARPAALGAVLVERAVRRLLAAAPEVGVVVERGQEPGESAPTDTRHATQWFGGATTAAIAAQWSATVSGRAAPRDLLLRLAETRRVAVDSPRGPGGERSPSGRPPAAETSRDNRARSTEDGATGAEETARSLLNETVEAGSRSAARRELSRPPLTKASVGGPPDPLEAVSTDVPARDLGPTSEAAARLKLRSAEAVSHGDELAVLAGQVKRILDEEARRHGIEV
jgi:hypothetical protein